MKVIQRVQSEVEVIFDMEGRGPMTVEDIHAISGHLSTMDDRPPAHANLVNSGNGRYTIRYRVSEIVPQRDPLLSDPWGFDRDSDEPPF